MLPVAMNALQLPGAASFGFLADFLLLAQPGHVIVGHFFEGVERDDVVHVQVDAMRLHSIGNALQLLLILGIDVRPKHLARGRAEELPIVLRLVGIEELDRLERVGDFRGQQVSVLKADLGRRAFEMNVTSSLRAESDRPSAAASS